MLSKHRVLGLFELDIVHPGHALSSSCSGTGRYLSNKIFAVLEEAAYIPASWE